MGSTVDPEEVSNYTKFSSRWWNKERPLVAITTENQVRLPRIINGLIGIGAVKQELIGASKPLNGLLILDAGCGGGYVSEELAKLGGTVVGIDPCAALIEVAKEHAALDSTVSNLEYRCETPEEHVVNNFEKYDAIVASEVIDHVSDSKLFLELCIKCLKPGGSIFITTKNRTLASWLLVILYLEKITRKLPRGTHRFERFLTPAETQTILQNCNCRVLSLAGSFYNILTNNWSETSSTAIFYAIHAVKQ